MHLSPQTKVYPYITKSYLKVVLAFAAGIFLLGSAMLLVNHQRTLEHLENHAVDRVRLALQVILEDMGPEKSILEPITPDHLSGLQADAERSDGLIFTLNGNGIGIYLIYGDDQTIDLNHPLFREKTVPALSAAALTSISQDAAIPLTMMRIHTSSHKVYHVEAMGTAQMTGEPVYIAAGADTGPSITRQNRFFIVQLTCWALAIGAVTWFAFRLIHHLASGARVAQKRAQNYSGIASARSAALEKLSLILEKSDNLIVLTNPEGKIIWLNESCVRKNNYSNKELSSFVGRELAEVSHYAPIIEAINIVKQTGEKYTYETKSFDESKEVFWSSTTITPIMNASGEIVQLLFIDSDITRLKAAEQRLEKLASIAHEDMNPSLLIERDHTVSFSNKAGEYILKMWGVDIGQKIDKASVVKSVEEAFRTQKEQTINVASQQRIFKLRLVPSENDPRLHVHGEDITESRQAQEAALARTTAAETHNLNLTDSMSYARRIQESLLPCEDQLRKYFKDSFALSMPKDILSGDFFWVYECVPQQQYLLALADCTGHGVPGAMMSIIGHSLLNEVVDTQKCYNPAAVLKSLNQELIKTLRQKSGHEQIDDGMDISLVHIDLAGMTITFSGAYHPLYHMNGKLQMIKGDRQPIGGQHHAPCREFQAHTLALSPGDAIYLFSDGIVDQFGGPHDKKFQSCRLKTLIENNHKYSMQAQSHLMRQTIIEWKGHGEQVDDISIIGIKF